MKLIDIYEIAKASADKRLEGFTVSEEEIFEATMTENIYDLLNA